MQRVRFDGCALGLKSSDGAPMYKPWTFSTNWPAITLRFAKNRRDGRHVRLKELSGKELRSTGFYTPELARQVHERTQATRRSKQPRGHVAAERDADEPSATPTVAGAAGMPDGGASCGTAHPGEGDTRDVDVAPPPQDEAGSPPPPEVRGGRCTVGA